MKRYHFPLAQVLRVRRIEEEQAAAELASARFDAESAADAQQARVSELAGCAAPPSGTAARFALWADRVTCAGGALTRATETKLVADQTMAARRAEWADAAMRVAALERLDERRRNAHRREALRDEIVTADDLVTSRRRQESE
jgi:flagellar FliJ protein